MREREISRVAELTPSLWSFMNHFDNIGQYRNESYQPTKTYLYSECQKVRPRLWCSYFFRKRGVKTVKDPNLAIKEFMEGFSNDPSFMRMAKKKIGKRLRFLPQTSPSAIPVIRQSSGSIPVVHEGDKNAVILDSFVCIEDYCP